jgi:spore germination protein
MKKTLMRISLILAVVMVLQLALAATVAAKEPTNEPAKELAAGGSGRWHLVRWGETLYSIGRMYGVSYLAIAQANGIRNPSRIYAGTWLLIPYGAPWPPQPGPRVYVVRYGDTLSCIARRFGTTVGAICQANHLWNPNRIRVGQRLIIPDC